ncbi:MAG: zeta toxin family protein [Actinomycetaceae bacterium]|nr:zeta toxin family protein [Actinomycetaceae bacterium]
MLSETELEEIFDAYIVPEFQAIANSAPTYFMPTLIVFGGQPGAGKSRSMAKVLREYPTAVEVVGDDFRRLHPDYEELMSSPGTALQMPEVTAQASGRWVEMSIEYLREQGSSVVLETTMRQPDVVARTMGEFHDAGYYCEMRVLAVPREVSLLGVLERYTYQVRENGAGRWAPVDMHDAAYNNAFQTLDELVSAAVVDRIVVTNRSSYPLYDTRTHSDIKVDEIKETITRWRDFTALSSSELSSWRASLEQVKATLTDFGEKNQDVLGVLKSLEVL